MNWVMDMGEESCSVMGIDLGTTYSCVGVWRNGRVEVVPNDQGNRITPSSVAFTDGERLIGEGANNQVASNASNTVFDVKRLMGRSFSDASVNSSAKYWPFGVIADARDKPLITVNYHGKEKVFSPEEISAMVLVKMKETAEAYVGPGTTITDAVITVPAYFNGSQRQATKDAGVIAGLKVLHIINEPTAAAIAYSVNTKWRESTVMVYDLGGGTLDVSLVVITQGLLQVIATAGDTHLGGQDFTNNMVDHFVNEFKNQNPYIIGDISGDKRALGRLRRSCEEAKRKLSTNQRDITVELDALFEGNDFYSDITRDQFEQLNVDLFRRCMEPIETCLMDAKMDKANVDEVVLVGGSTRIPHVHKLVQEFFNGKELCRNINADEAVAYGATVQAAILTGTYSPDEPSCLVDSMEKANVDDDMTNWDPSCIPYLPKIVKDHLKKKEPWKSVNADGESVAPLGGTNKAAMLPGIQTFPQVIDITPFSQGIGMLEGLICVVVPRNTTLHTWTEMEFTTTEYNKSSMDIMVYEGEMAMPKKFLLTGIALSPKGVAKCKVRFEMNQDGILEVSAQDKDSGQEGKTIITSDPARFSTDEIKIMLQDAKEYKAQDEEHKNNLQARNDIQNLLYTISNNMKQLEESATRLLFHPEATREQETEIQRSRRAHKRQKDNMNMTEPYRHKELPDRIKKLREIADETTEWLENKELTTSEILDRNESIKGEYDSISRLIESASR